MACWWSVHRWWFFSLSTLATSAPWDTPKGKKRVYSDGTFSFHESEIEGNFDELEEALWAFRHGLSNVVYDLTLSPRISKKLLKHLRNRPKKAR